MAYDYMIYNQVTYYQKDFDKTTHNGMIYDRMTFYHLIFGYDQMTNDQKVL
jgi:hypothetical protein